MTAGRTITRAYVPAARRLDNVPGLITNTDSTTYMFVSMFCYQTFIRILTLTVPGSTLGVINTSGRTFSISPSLR